MIKGVFFISLKIDILWECFPLDYQCPFSVCFRLLQSRYLVQRWNLIPYPNCTYIVYIPRWRKLISTWKVVICVSLNYNWFEHDLLHTQSVQGDRTQYCCQCRLIAHCTFHQDATQRRSHIINSFKNFLTEVFQCTHVYLYTLYCCGRCLLYDFISRDSTSNNVKTDIAIFSPHIKSVIVNDN